MVVSSQSAAGWENQLFLWRGRLGPGSNVLVVFVDKGQQPFTIPQIFLFPPRPSHSHLLPDLFVNTVAASCGQQEANLNNIMILDLIHNLDHQLVS